MKKQASYCTAEELEKGDIFFLNREWEWVCVEEIVGFSLNGGICFWVEVCDMSKPKTHIEIILNFKRKVRLYD